MSRVITIVVEALVSIFMDAAQLTVIPMKKNVSILKKLVHVVMDMAETYLAKWLQMNTTFTKG